MQLFTVTSFPAPSCLDPTTGCGGVSTTLDGDPDLNSQCCSKTPGQAGKNPVIPELAENRPVAHFRWSISLPAGVTEMEETGKIRKPEMTKCTWTRLPRHPYYRLTGTGCHLHRKKKEIPGHKKKCSCRIRHQPHFSRCLKWLEVDPPTSTTRRPRRTKV